MPEFSLGDAISGDDDGVRILIRVTPSSRTDAVKGFDRWRGRVRIDISAPPVKGKANNQIISFFRKLFPECTGVRIESGGTARDKCVGLDGVGIREAHDILEVFLSE